MTAEYLLELHREELRIHIRKSLAIAERMQLATPESIRLARASTERQLAYVEQAPLSELAHHYLHCSICQSVLGTEDELLVLIARATDRQHLSALCQDKFRCSTHWRPIVDADDEDDEDALMAAPDSHVGEDEDEEDTKDEVEDEEDEEDES